MKRTTRTVKTSPKRRWTWIDDLRLSLRSKDFDELAGLQKLHDGKTCPSDRDMEIAIAVRAELSRREGGIERQLAT